MKIFRVFALILTPSLMLVGLFALARPVQAACRTNEITFHIITRDVDGNLIPNINYAIHHQNTDPDGNPYLGPSLTTGKTDAGGQFFSCVRADMLPFAVNVYEYNASYGNRKIWNDQISVDVLGQYVVDVKLSYLNLIVRNGAGELVKYVKFDVYQQSFDVDGAPIIDEEKIDIAKIISDKYNTGVTGQTRAYVAAGTYVVRIHGTGSSYFYYFQQDVVNTAATRLEPKLTTLRVILEDGLGTLLKDRKYDLYQQAFDVRGAPILGTLVMSGLDVGTAGKVDAYVPAGSYALKIPGSLTGSFYTNWRVSVVDRALTTRTYRLSGFRIILNVDGVLAKNAAFSIGTQATDAAGAPVVKQTIINTTTGDLGYSDIYLIPGRYVLTYGSNRVYNLDVFENQFTTIDWPKSVSIRPRKDVTLTTPINNRLTLQAVKDAVVKGIGNYKKRISKTYTITAQKLTAPYTLTFSYDAKALQAVGINPTKLRIAYYNPKTKKWKLVGRNEVAKQKASMVAASAGTFVLVLTK